MNHARHARIRAMQRLLIAHPTTPCEHLDSLAVHFERDARTLVLRYEIAGAVERILLPAQTGPERRDGLWQHTCFEIFARSAGARSYVEFNFSPSTYWAAYAFDDYRAGMRALEYRHVPSIRLSRDARSLTLETQIELDFAADATLDRFALAAVIEDIDHRKSYWALAHPTAQPDFHHPDAFALAVAPGAMR